jgi:hypothetical protein
VSHCCYYLAHLTQNQSQRTCNCHPIRNTEKLHRHKKEVHIPGKKEKRRKEAREEGAEERRGGRDRGIERMDGGKGREGRKKREREGRKEGRKEEGGKEGRKEGRRNIQCTSITTGTFLISNNEIISKKKMEMPKAIRSLLALLREPSRQECAVG